MIQDVIHVQNLSMLLNLCKTGEDEEDDEEDDCFEEEGSVRPENAAKGSRKVSSSSAGCGGKSKDVPSGERNEEPYQKVRKVLRFCDVEQRLKLLSYVDSKGQTLLHE